MICIECLNIDFNRMLLLAVGLWPYQRSKLARFQIILLLTILTSFVIFQITAFLTLKFTADLVINVSSSVLLYTIFVIKYSWFHSNIEVVKCFLEQLQNIYNELTDANEINIIKKYNSDIKRCTIGLMLSVILPLPAPILYQFCPNFFDILLFINESRRFPLKKIIVTEYFIDQKKYYYLILLHANVALFIGLVTIIATGMILIVYQQFACGMFRIASYRIERAMTVDILRKDSLRNKNWTYKKLIRAVNMHREAIKLSNSSLRRFKIMFFFVVIIMVIGGSLNLFRIFQALSLKCNFEEFLFPLISMAVYIIYIFIACYIGQQIMDHNIDVFAAA
ncbi:uncharacterized protein [Anoplolepis gracilipes]